MLASWLIGADVIECSLQLLPLHLEWHCISWDDIALAQRFSYGHRIAPLRLGFSLRGSAKGEISV